MKQLKGWTKMMGVGAIAAVTMAGCTPQQEATVEDDMANTGQTMDNTAEGAGDAATGVGENAAEFATITPNIKAALGDNAAMNGSNIDVDTDVSNNVVHLHGTVVDDAQKNLAEEVARQELAKIQEASQFTVQNELTIGAAGAGATGTDTGAVPGDTNTTTEAPATP